MFEMSDSGKETLSLEGLMKEVSSNATEEDDFIFASQTLQIHRNEKIKPIKKFKSISKNNNLLNSVLLLQKVNCGFVNNAKNEVNIENKQLFTSTNQYFEEETNFRDDEKSIDDFIKNTQQDIFISSLYSDRDQKVPKTSQNSNSGKSFFAKTQNIEWEVKPKRSTEPLENCDTELLITSKTENNFDSFWLPLTNQTFNLNSVVGRKENLQENSVSRALFTDDCRNSNKIQTRDFHENLTSGIILPTQPLEFVNCKRHKDVGNSLANSQSFILRHEVSEKNIFENDLEKSEIDLNWEKKTLNFKIAISCLVKKNKNTNEIIEKVILNVNELPKFKQYLKSDSSDEFRKDLDDDGIANRQKRDARETKESTSDLRWPKAEKRMIDNLMKRIEKDKKSMDRIQWINGNLLLSKLDDLIEDSLGASITNYSANEKMIELCSVGNVKEERFRNDSNRIEEEDDDEEIFFSGDFGTEKVDQELVSSAVSKRMIENFYRGKKNSKKGMKKRSPLKMSPRKEKFNGIHIKKRSLEKKKINKKLKSGFRLTDDSLSDKLHENFVPGTSEANSEKEMEITESDSDEEKAFSMLRILKVSKSAKSGLKKRKWNFLRFPDGEEEK